MAEDGGLDRTIAKHLTARNGWARTTDRTRVLDALTPADWVSIAALFVAWVSALLFVRGATNWALVVMVGAVALDKVDGAVARRLGVASAFGRQIDSFLDVFAYLVTAAVLYHVELAPNLAVSALVGFAILAFGGLRLVRHNAEGFEEADDVRFYHGTTVVHTNLVVVLNYFLAILVDPWNGWLAALTILVAAPLMISEYRSPKTMTAHVTLGAIAALVVVLAVLVELGVI